MKAKVAQPGILRFLSRADDVLRADRWVCREGTLARQLPRLLLLMVVFGMMHGAVIGSYGIYACENFLQILYSALKVPLLLIVTFGLSLPSFFVINTLMGLRDDFKEALRALVATQAGLTIILASFAPFVALWYASFNHYPLAILFNTFIFGSASVIAQYLLRNLYRPLIERDRRHRWMLIGWLIIYAFVGVQMGWVLRPFIGAPGAATTFFREEAWGNAYVLLMRLVMNLL